MPRDTQRCIIQDTQTVEVRSGETASWVKSTCSISLKTWIYSLGLTKGQMWHTSVIAALIGQEGRWRKENYLEAHGAASGWSLPSR